MSRAIKPKTMATVINKRETAFLRFIILQPVPMIRCEALKISPALTVTRREILGAMLETLFMQVKFESISGEVKVAGPRDPSLDGSQSRFRA